MNFRGTISKFVSYIIPFLVFFSIFFPQGSFAAQHGQISSLRAGSYLPGKLVVTLDDASVTSAFAQQHIFSQVTEGLRVISLRAEKESHILKTHGTRFVVNYDASEGAPESIAKKLLSRPHVLSAGPEFLYHAAQTIDDPDFHLSDGLFNSGSNVDRGSETFDADVDAEQAWATTKGSGAIIAVVDSGVDIAHPDLAANIWVNSADPVDGVDNDIDGFIDDHNGWNFVGFDYSGPGYTARPEGDPNLTPSNDPIPKPNGVNEDGIGSADDGSNHGTHVSGIAAARMGNGEGTSGVAPEATIMPLRALDDEGNGVTSQILDAIDFATVHGADVINMSFSTGPIGSEDTSFNRAIEDAWGAGIILVAAAGNSNNNLALNPESPVVNDCGESCETGSNKILGVASVTNSDDRASYSNYSSSGTMVDVSAPGGALTLNRAIYSTTYKNLSYACCQEQYGYESGTSMAAPVVAGVVALIRSANPEMTPTDVRDRVRNFSDTISAANMGTGRVNAAHAVLGSLITRSSGATRYDTAVQTSQFSFPADGSASAVVLASGENFPDGLGASALAHAKNAPLLLTPKSSLPAAVLTEINRVLTDKTKTIYIAGGASAVATSISSALTTDGFTTIQRFAGSDRVETAQDIADEVSPGDIFSVFLVNKDNFPDALSAAAVAAERSTPMFLNASGSLNSANLSWFQAHGVGRVYLIGGTAVLSASVASDLNTHGISTIRLSGSDRYSTSAEVAKCFYSTSTSSPCSGITSDRAEPEYLGVALGQNFPDALSGGPYLGMYPGPLLLVQSTSLPSVILSYLSDVSTAVRDVLLFGGTSVVSDATSTIIGTSL